MRKLDHHTSSDGNSIHRQSVFERVLFAQCWEDPEMDRQALRLEVDEVALVVTSGGCTALSLALERPGRIIAVDMNSAQTRLLELKIAGARALDHGGYLELLGVRPSRRRRELYRASRVHLSPEAVRFWDAHEKLIQGNLIRSGRYEQYLNACRKLLLVIQGPRRIRRLFELESADDRRRFYREEWDGVRWRLFFRTFFSRPILGRFGLDPAFFTYVDGVTSFGEHFRRLAEHVIVDLPARDNYFLAQICLGHYLNERAVPPYLRADNFDRLRRSLDRIEPRTAELESLLHGLPDGSVDAFALSNVFEWVSPDVFERILGEIHRVGSPGARICYRNLLVRRTHPASCDGQFRPDRDLAAKLLFEDRSFVYSNFEVATATPVATQGGVAC
jgi:S-adenosylmethionine-diacylglycerol 3-amino-3-carboxypropyl transferase